jgi:prepilin-type processing-associated H-X9-DG protein
MIGVGKNYLDPKPAGTAWANGTANGYGRAWGWGNYATAFSTIMPPNSAACQGQYHMVAGPNSYHTGGVNAAYADGSVRFIPETINTGDPDKAPVLDGPSPYGVWGALGSANGGESESL